MKKLVLQDTSPQQTKRFGHTRKKIRMKRSFQEIKRNCHGETVPIWSIRDGFASPQTRSPQKLFSSDKAPSTSTTYGMANFLPINEWAAETSATAATAINVPRLDTRASIRLLTTAAVSFESPQPSRQQHLKNFRLNGNYYILLLKAFCVRDVYSARDGEKGSSYVKGHSNFLAAILFNVLSH